MVCLRCSLTRWRKLTSRIEILLKRWRRQDEDEIKPIELELFESYKTKTKVTLEVEPTVAGDYTSTLKLDFK